MRGWFAILAAVMLAPPAASQPAELVARTIQTWPADEAGQGAAVDDRHFYAVDNSAIGKYRRADGTLVRRWTGPKDGPIAHLNSCYASARRLWCANSNYPALPMGSSIEVFDADTLAHVESRSLGLMDEGSLVWFAPLGSGWIAGFAHYDRADGKGGTGFKDARYGNVVTFDREWRRTGGWLYPAAVQERMKPHSASGGAIGPDGLLYILGHDRPEMYVLAKPAMGPYLVHVATIALEVYGQAFSFAPEKGRRIVALDRTRKAVRLIELPAVGMPLHLDDMPAPLRFADGRR